MKFVWLIVSLTPLSVTISVTSKLPAAEYTTFGYMDVEAEGFAPVKLH
jgi:hypothetical protein